MKTFLCILPLLGLGLATEEKFFFPTREGLKCNEPYWNGYNPETDGKCVYNQPGSSSNYVSNVSPKGKCFGTNDLECVPKSGLPATQQLELGSNAGACFPKTYSNGVFNKCYTNNGGTWTLATCNTQNPDCGFGLQGDCNIEGQAGITNSARINELLDAHNDRRSRLALGNEDRNNGTHNYADMPGASDMKKMGWDADLAIRAQDLIAHLVANKIEMEHDANNVRGACFDRYNLKVGQNLAMSSSTHSAPSTASPWLDSMVGLWYREVFDYVETYITNHQGKEFHRGVVGHFTAMVWSTSEFIGCAEGGFVKNGKYVELLACNYGPGGNTIGGTVYKQGSASGSCPYSGYSRLSNGLCTKCGASQILKKNGNGDQCVNSI